MRKTACVERIGIRILLAAAALAACPLGSPASARETPKSYGRAANVDYPILRVPERSEPPTIDGKMAPGEWENASALSAFWYLWGGGQFKYLAPDETQVEVYAAYDDKALYLAVTSAVYPRGSWLRARGRFPDVLKHPQYGILWDDHVELELRPHEDLSEAFQHGLLRFDVNSIGTVADWYFSPKYGKRFAWDSGAKIRSRVTDERWILEYRIPFKGMRYKGYAGKTESGEPLVPIPPKPGMVFRAWFARAIGGGDPYFNAFGGHQWNTTKMKLILDPNAPSFQLKELGPIMKDRINVKLTVKNHSDQSKTLLIGFFVEDPSGTIYSSYDAKPLNEGLLELTPGERRTIRLKKDFPGIAKNGNVLWFDVRAAGNPAKQLFRTRLTPFHSMEGGSKFRKVKVETEDGKTKTVKRERTFRERELEAIKKLRPKKKKFLLRWNFASYTRSEERGLLVHDKKLSAVVDKGIRSAPKEVKRAAEMRVMVVSADPSRRVIAEGTAPFRGNFAQIDLKASDMARGEKYQLTVLLFDENKRIVGEKQSEPFTYTREEWEGHNIGESDVVWAPFEPMKVTKEGFSTLKHEFALTDAGLPAQIRIAPDRQDMPLEKRGSDDALSTARLQAMGHGPQLRGPVRLAGFVAGKKREAKVVDPAKLVRKWKSELVYESRLRLGPVRIELRTRYDCDGSMHCRLTYGAKSSVRVKRLQLVWPAAGPVTMALSESGKGAMAAADVWELSLPRKTGTIWDSSDTNIQLFEGKFVPYFFFGSGDRGWTWYCDSDKGWMLDEKGSTMRLERNESGAVTWRVSFVNHPSELEKTRNVRFHVLTHPAKPKPEDYRKTAWHYLLGKGWATGYANEPIDVSKKYLKKRWHEAALAPKDIPWKKAETFRKDEPPWRRYGQWRNVGRKFHPNITPELDQTWVEKGTYYLARQIRVGRRVGWWMDEYFPVAFGRSNNIAAGNAYMRDPETVDKGKEIPYQSGFLTQPMRNHYKRLARVSKKSNVPQRQHTWANNAGTFLESFIYNTVLVEGAGAANDSYELDVVTKWPISLYRYFAKPFTGLVTTAMPGENSVPPGDDPRIDRQVLGRTLLHDIGMAPKGAHGTIRNAVHGVRLLRKLTGFGFFEKGVEVFPYWRNGDAIRMKGAPGTEGKLYVTVYRRRIEDGEGIEALIVIMNESDEPVTRALRVADPGRIFGGKNTLAAAEIRAKATPPDGLAGWWKSAREGRPGGRALRDLETGAVIPAAGKDGAYGPIHVPYHDFRVLYGRHAPGGSR